MVRDGRKGLKVFLVVIYNNIKITNNTYSGYSKMHFSSCFYVHISLTFQTPSYKSTRRPNPVKSPQGTIKFY